MEMKDCINIYKSNQNSQFVNDGQKSDYKIIWYDSSESKMRECSVFSYGGDLTIVRAIFKLLYPGNDIFSIIKNH